MLNKRIQSLDLKTIGYLFLPSLFIGGVILLFNFNANEFDLVSIQQLVMSEATSFGVDVAKRVSFLYDSILKLLFFLTLFTSILYILIKRFKIDQIHFKSWNVIAIIGIINLLAHLIGSKNDILEYTFLWLFVFKLVSDSIAAKFKTLKFLSSIHFLGLNSSAAYLLYFLTVYLFGLKNIEQFYAFFFTYLTVLTVSVSIIYLKLKYSFRSVYYYLTILILIPYLIFISTEVQFLYYKNYHSFLGYKKIFLISFVGISSILLYAFKKSNFSTKQLFNKFWIVSIISMFAISVWYFPLYEETGELFELGNPANSLLRIFQFNEIPFVDFLSSHLLSEQWYGIIYSLIFGFNNQLDFLIYEFFNQLIFLIVVYYFIKKTFNSSILGLGFVFTLPFLNVIFFQYVFLSIILFLYIEKYKNQHSIKHYTGVFLLILLLIIWRLDTAISGIMTSFIYLGFLFIIDKFSIHFKKLLQSILVSGLSLFLVLLITISVRGKNYILQNLDFFFSYISGNQTHGHASLTYGQLYHQVELYHIIFPFLALLAVLYIIFILFKERENNEFKGDFQFVLKASLFLFLLFFVNFQRGLVRHGFAELNESFLISVFYLAFSLLAIYLFKKNEKSMQFVVFYASCFILFVSTKYFNLGKSESPFQKSISKNAFINLNSIFNTSDFKGKRTVYSSNHKNYQELKLYFDKNLKNDETFIDFSNSPLLYYYSNRRIIGYFNQNLQNLVGEVAQYNYIKLIQKEKVPMVIFSSFPKDFFDKLDDIPNEVRYHLISEYIYSHYEPVGVIENKSLWKLKGFSTNYIPQKDSIIAQPQTYHYKKTAYYFANYFKNHSKAKLKSIFKTKVDAFDLLKNCKKTQHCFLNIELKNNTNSVQTVWVELRGENNEDLGKFTFETTENIRDSYFLRLSNHYFWHSKNVASIHVVCPSGVTTVKQEILKDNRY